MHDKIANFLLVYLYKHTKQQSPGQSHSKTFNFFFLCSANDTAYDKETAFAGSEVTAYAWQNIWEWGVAKRAYNLANAGYKVDY